MRYGLISVRAFSKLHGLGFVRTPLLRFSLLRSAKGPPSRRPWPYNQHLA